MIFITGKAVDRRIPYRGRYAPSTEPVIFITGKDSRVRAAMGVTVTFNGAGELHHRKGLVSVTARVGGPHPSTEPVIFITGKQWICRRSAPGSGAFNGAGDLHHRKAQGAARYRLGTLRFNGAGDLHHRKGPVGRGHADGPGLASTEPVIFITGKVRGDAEVRHRAGASTEPVIFITGKGLASH